MKRKHPTKKAPFKRGWKRPAIVAAGVFLVGLLGLGMLRMSGAATYATSKEVESATLAGKAQTTSSTSASGGSAVTFGQTTPTGTMYWSDAPTANPGKNAPIGGGWTASSWNIVSGTMGVIADSEKGKAVSFNVTGGSGSKQRVEGTISLDPQIGKTHYLGFDLKLSNTATNAANGWQCIMQIKSSPGEGNPSFELEVDKGNLYAMSNRKGQPNQKVYVGKAPLEKWSRIVLMFTVTKSSSTSKLSSWQDGTQTINNLSWVAADNTGESNGQGGFVYNVDSSAYYKFGLYRGAGNNFPMNVRYANMKIGSTYDIVSR